ncbi:MAG: DUF1343 domain-containing protein [Firmicutes bacterium]|nr:DUF1343 domain-containing protein [Bacillota bacterium]
MATSLRTGKRLATIGFLTVEFLALFTLFTLWTSGLAIAADAPETAPASLPALPATAAPPSTHVKPGIEVLLEKHLGLLEGKRIGLVTNQTGVNSQLIHDADLLRQVERQMEKQVDNQAESTRLAALFAPEHGLRGDRPAGEYVPSYIDPQTKLPVYSLYGKTRKPTPEMLAGIDLLLIDLQDVGARAYTYISTMANVMMAARENHLPVMVLDRPNPIGGVAVEGPVLEDDFRSFIGMYPIPVRHGMTIGELAGLFNKEFGIDADLTVIPMEGWRREMFFADTGLPWVATSPNIPKMETPIFYPGAGLIGEAGFVEGAGTDQPFEYVAAPGIDGSALAESLNGRGLAGVRFKPISVVPARGGYAGKTSGGVQLEISDTRAFRPVETAVYILTAIRDQNPDRSYWPRVAPGARNMFDLAMGTDAVRLAIQRGEKPETIIAAWQEKLSDFMAVRARYLIY